LEIYGLGREENGFDGRVLENIRIVLEGLEFLVELVEVMEVR
jgi:hypothetical protein